MNHNILKLYHQIIWKIRIFRAYARTNWLPKISETPIIEIISFWIFYVACMYIIIKIKQIKKF